MKRPVPIIPTLIVLAAVAIMVRLGFWQLDRLQQKDALLMRYVSALRLSSEARWPESPAEVDKVLYRRATLACTKASGATTIAGQSASGVSGQAHVVDCLLADGAKARVVLGWSRDPVAPDWLGGRITGWIAPGPRLVADPPLAGLQANARPDPRDLPNNHMAYAVQWFLFAATALTIYGLALRKRLAAIDSQG